MPLPSPKKGQTQDEFISACMGSSSMRAEFPGQAQRSAVCHSQWRRRMRRIKKARIQFISLVPKGANKLPVIYKADDTFEFSLLKAGDDIEKGEITAVVYAPELRDSQGDIASADVIKEMCHEAARGGFDVDIRHDGRAVGRDKAFVAESFIIQKGDPRFQDTKDYDGQTVDVTGAWGILLKVDDPGLRTLYRDGEWNGVSMAGQAVVEHEKHQLDPDGFAEALAKRLGLDDGDDDMKPCELEAILAKNNEALIGLLKAETPEPKPEPKPEPDSGKPVFKGDPLKLDDVQKHAEALERWNLQKDVDWDNPESVAVYQEKLAGLTKKDEPDEALQAKINDLEKQIEALRKSRRRTNTVDHVEDDVPEGFSKEDLDCFKIGREMAAYINGEAAS